MKLADTRILANLAAIRQAFAGAGAGIGGGGGGAGQVTLAIEAQTDMTNLLGLMGAAGSSVAGHQNNLIAQRYGIDRILVSTVLVNGTVRLASIYLPKPKTITGVRWFAGGTGSGFTPVNTNQVGLYSYATGTMTRRANSASNNALWSTFGVGLFGWANFVTPYVAPAGLYFIAYLFCGTGGTAPGLGAYTSLSSGAGGGASIFTDAFFHLVCTLSGQTALPATIQTSTVGAASPTGYHTWGALY